MELPCDADGICMVCKVIPPDSDVLLCNSCSSPWHLQCLQPPLDAVPEGSWHCPDCADIDSRIPVVGNSVISQSHLGVENSLTTKILAIQADSTLNEDQKARKRQELMTGMSDQMVLPNPRAKKKGSDNTEVARSPQKSSTTLALLDEKMNCIFCLQLVDRPVTTPCGHNFCLKCFQKWIGQGKKTCGKCRAAIPPRMASQPRINAALVVAIRLAKAAATGVPKTDASRQYKHIANETRPDKAFTTERAVKTGKANACSGRIFVTIPPDYFGPITAEYDPDRGQGVLVGESWEDRMECRQWGAHFPHVAGIAGQADHGAQSVALSGGYEDDEDNGEWFLYTGSGGRDLSGNKRTNKEHSFDQKFESANEALRLSCKKGYPVRVVRSHKEKRSSYAPESGVRYDGIYRIEKCWRKKGAGGFLVCRYLFVRCDNEPAPWTSDVQGDRPRDLPKISELKDAKDIMDRKSVPAWTWKEEDSEWGWQQDPPESKKLTGCGPRRASFQGIRKQLNVQQRLLKEFGCIICKKILRAPVSTPCGHNFCKACLQQMFKGVSDSRKRRDLGNGRSLRVQKTLKPCPAPRCGMDLTELLLKPEVNREMVDIIETLQTNAKVVEEGAENNSEGQEGAFLAVSGINSPELKHNSNIAVPTIEPAEAYANGYVRDSEDEEEAVGISGRAERNAKDSGRGQATEKGAIHQPIAVTARSCAREGLAGHTSLGPTEATPPGSADPQRIPALQGTVTGTLGDEDSKFYELCEAFAEYDKSLLRNMLEEQEGDLEELEAILKQMKRDASSAYQRQAGSIGVTRRSQDDRNGRERQRSLKAGTSESGEKAKLMHEHSNFKGNTSANGLEGAQRPQSLDSNNQLLEEGKDADGLGIAIAPCAARPGRVKRGIAGKYNAPSTRKMCLRSSKGAPSDAAAESTCVNAEIQIIEIAEDSD